MKATRNEINTIPALVWGEPSDKVLLCVHGKMGFKECVEGIAEIAQEKGYQTISFDLPQHGERKDEVERCDIWNGIRDLTLVGDYVFSRWKEVSLYACSLGAYFSLHAYPKREFKQCLFQSPILDMEYLIGQMMLWFDVSEERLCREQEVNTPIDVLSWNYFQYVKDHPVSKWNIPTCILYAGKDNLQSRDVVTDFASRFGCSLTVSEQSEHPFMDEGDGPVVERWLRENLSRKMKG